MSDRKIILTMSEESFSRFAHHTKEVVNWLSDQGFDIKYVDMVGSIDQPDRINTFEKIGEMIGKLSHRVELLEEFMENTESESPLTQIMQAKDQIRDLDSRIEQLERSSE